MRISISFLADPSSSANLEFNRTAEKTKGENYIKIVSRTYYDGELFFLMSDKQSMHLINSSDDLVQAHFLPVELNTERM